jgi:hypothetical protein
VIQAGLLFEKCTGFDPQNTARVMGSEALSSTPEDLDILDMLKILGVSDRQLGATARESTQRPSLGPATVWGSST